MKECWLDDRDARPTFLELKGEFDDFISHKERYNYLLLEGETAEGEESAVPAAPPTASSGSVQ